MRPNVLELHGHYAHVYPAPARVPAYILRSDQCFPFQSPLCIWRRTLRTVPWFSLHTSVFLHRICAQSFKA